MKGNQVGAKCVVGVFGVDNFWKIKWVDTNIGVEGETNVGTTDGVAEALILIFWVDNENFGASHH